MKLKKLTMGMVIAFLSTGLLFGCGTPNDEQEPDPTEEPSEQQQQNENDMDGNGNQ
ncbi:hypothetical protein [Oceanobacillus piezotolerans]|uniref:hypothetical protein n=1 Tax=Oceanobacillus piezotolerans TaxID=2448030 RepID=UPI0016571C61|nr:hypothetical protein [Oceanobacillus piezotolerans]